MLYCFYVQYSLMVSKATEPSVFEVSASAAPASSAASDPVAAQLAGTRVVKRLKPNQRGALKLARRYGDALVCVRYRHSADGKLRFTTVELVVDHAPMAPKRRSRPDPLVLVRLPWLDQRRIDLLTARGATWDDHRCLWSMPESVAALLGLRARIVQR